jgi:endonuclease YncB( thermonuclease family)
LVVLACLALLCAPLLLRSGSGFEAEAASTAAASIPAHDLRVIDGDTLENLHTGERFRIVNVDTAELSDGASCSAERAHAQAARSRLRAMLRQSDLVRLDRAGQDAYGRTLAHVRIDGADVGAVLVSEGFARPWTGRREPWCSSDGRLLR